MVDYQITAEANDGWVEGQNSNYATAKEVATLAYPSENWLKTGQHYTPPNPPFTPEYYWIFRLFLKFDTRAIPVDAEIFGANIRLLYGYTIPPDIDFTIRVQKWTGDTPIELEDYMMFDGVNYDDGLFNTSEYMQGAWHKINLINFDCITKAGWTKLCLRSQNDIDAILPTDNENVAFGAYEDARVIYLTVFFLTHGIGIAKSNFKRGCATAFASHTRGFELGFEEGFERTVYEATGDAKSDFKAGVAKSNFKCGQAKSNFKSGRAKALVSS